MASPIEEAGKKAQSILKNAGLDIKDGIQISPKMTAEKFQKYKETQKIPYSKSLVWKELD